MYSSWLTAAIVPVEVGLWGITIIALIVFGILVLFKESLGKVLERTVDVQVRWRWLGFFLHLQASELQGSELQASEHKEVDADSAPAPALPVEYP